MRRDRRAILRGAAVASVASGAPSTVWALAHGRDPLAQGLAATRAIGTLVAPGSPGLVRGALAHGAISLAVGGALGVALPRRGSVASGALAGLAIGWVNLAVIAPQRYPAIAALPLGPQLADNAAFGAIFAAVADRGRPSGLALRDHPRRASGSLTRPRRPRFASATRRAGRARAR